MRPTSSASVAVIIPCFEQARFLSTAIESAIAQTVSAQEIVVVDDGSTEDVAAVTSNYPQVRLIRRGHRGPSAARNAGVDAVTSDRIAFLDADDVLLPGALRAGLNCFESHPDAAFVYGAFWERRGNQRAKMFSPVTTHRELVQCNWIGMIATVMFDRQKLVEVGGFDEALRMAEDWDLFLRLSRRFSFIPHSKVVAEYARHDRNTTNNLSELKRWIDVVRAKEWERGLDPACQRAWHEGSELWRPTLEGAPIRQTNPIVRAARKAARLLTR